MGCHASAMDADVHRDDEGRPTAPRRRARADDRLARVRRRRRRAARRLRRVRPGRDPGRSRARRRRQVQARLRRGPGDRDRGAEPRADRRAEHPGAPWQVLPYERQLEVKHAQVDDALRRIGKLDGFALEPIVPAVEQWRYRNKLEYSFGTDASGRLVCGFHAPGRWNDIIEMSDCLLASEAGQRRARGGRAVVPRARAHLLRPPQRRGLPAQPRRPGGTAHRPAPGAARDEAGRARPRRARDGGATAGGVLWTRVDGRPRSRTAARRS